MSEGAASLINLSWTWFALDTKMMMLRRLGWMVSVYVAAAGWLLVSLTRSTSYTIGLSLEKDAL